MKILQLRYILAIILMLPLVRIFQQRYTKGQVYQGENH